MTAHLGTVTYAWEGVPITRAQYDVLEDVLRERARQVAKWGDDSAKDHEDGTGRPGDAASADLAKFLTDTLAEQGRVTWRAILQEEVAEALAESDRAKLRTELIQVAAVAVKWVEAIDRREAGQ